MSGSGVGVMVGVRVGVNVGEGLNVGVSVLVGVDVGKNCDVASQPSDAKITMMNAITETKCLLLFILPPVFHVKLSCPFLLKLYVKPDCDFSGTKG